MRKCAPLPDWLARGASRIAPDLLPSALTDYQANCGEPGGAPKPFAEIVDRKPDPGRGTLVVSRAGVSADQTQAVISVSRQSGPLNGAGELWFLRKAGRGWMRLYTLTLWVS